ncbi:MAG: MoaD/ThiS family protein [Planctomycetes bacterium]|nr:MoaD/ThiS family protein [Planctomycetota bacterium]
MKLFASLREAVGSQEVTVSLPAGSTAGDLLQAVAAAYPEVARQRQALSVAVDRVIRGAEHVLTPGAEVALLPPVGGG